MVTDFTTFRERGQAYVVLSRIRNLNQLYITKFDPEKIQANEDALAETERLEENSSNPFEELKIDNNSIIINIFNTSSLKKHFPRIIKDRYITKAQIIFLSETNLTKKLSSTFEFHTQWTEMLVGHC